LSTLSDILERVRYLYRTGQIKHVITRALPFALRWLVGCESYYLYEYDLGEFASPEEDFLPRVKDFTFKVITTKAEADELEAQGVPFYSCAMNVRERLEMRAIAFCTVIDRELAYVGWVALSEAANRSLGQARFLANFRNKEAVVAGVETNPKYRQKGLMEYNAFRRMAFLENRGGVTKIRCAIDKNNIPCQRGTVRVGFRRTAEARRLRILYWEFWRERRI